MGHDTHRLIPGGPLHLGGMDIPHDARLHGHSDADVLLHAVTDALLGAIAAGDIGDMFPDTAAVNRGRDSVDMLALAWERVQLAGYRVQNLDCIVFAERPQLGAYKPQIRQRLADILGILPEQVGLQAKTGEGVGPIGREEAIAAQCIVLLSRVAAVI
jgi:2-C-methyl-D-erythritol 2,4-cyclodiphosphate synthase